MKLRALRKHTWRRDEADMARQNLAVDAMEMAMFFLDLTFMDWVAADRYMRLAVAHGSGRTLPDDIPLHWLDGVIRKPKESMRCVVCGKGYDDHPQPEGHPQETYRNPGGLRTKTEMWWLQ